MMTEQSRQKPDERRQARRGLTIYLLVLFTLSAPLYVALIARAQPVYEQTGLIAILMWSPAVATLVTRFAMHEGLRGTGLGILGRRSLRPVATALAFPIAIGAVSYGAAWALGLASFTTPPNAPGGFSGFAAAVGRALLIGTPLGIITVAGEEIGWRGYMSGRLRQAGLPVPDTIGGLIWAAWHTPLIITGQYAAGPHALLAVLGFGMLAVGLHTLWSEWLTRTGSLWPAIIAHSAWNVVIQHPFDGHTTGAESSLWLGDSGLLTAGLAFGVAIFLVRLLRRELPGRFQGV